MNRQEWAIALLQRLGISPNEQNVSALVAWQQAEGTRARYNPLATTQPAPGADNFNSVGVKDYATQDQGLDATVKTLRNGNYPNILSALKSGTAYDVGNAVLHSPWGTGSGLLSVLQSASVPHSPPPGKDGAHKGGFANNLLGILEPTNPFSTGGSGKVPDPLGVGHVVGGAISAGEFLGKLGEGDTWKRVGYVVGGGLLGVIGIIVIIRPSNLPGPIGTVAKVAKVAT